MRDIAGLNRQLRDRPILESGRRRSRGVRVTAWRYCIEIARPTFVNPADPPTTTAWVPNPHFALSDYFSIPPSSALARARTPPPFRKTQSRSTRAVKRPVSSRTPARCLRVGAVESSASQPVAVSQVSTTHFQHSSPPHPCLLPALSPQDCISDLSLAAPRHRQPALFQRPDPTRRRRQPDLDLGHAQQESRILVFRGRGLVRRRRVLR